MDTFSKVKFILQKHEALEEEERRALAKLLNEAYEGSPLSVSKLYEIECLYHEAVGIG